MENKIPQKSFDAQMHIIRDVHFDVDKYKVGELYVINQKDPGYLSVQGKTVAQLREVNEHELKFKVLALNYDPKTGNSYNTYSIGGLRFTIDDIIDRQIEIERLLTETEAVVYLTSAIAKECAKDIIPEPINEKPTLADKYKGDLSIYTPLLRTPNPSPFDQMILSSKSRLKSDIQAAYKINSKEEAEELAKNSMLKIAEEVYDSSLDEYRNYTVNIPEMGEPFSFVNINWKFNIKAFENLCGQIEVTLRKGSNQIRFNTSNKFIFVTEDTIRILNRRGLNVTIYNNDFRESFDKIEFKVIQ